MKKDELLLVGEAVARLRLRGPQNFARFARRHGIPIVRFGARIRVRRSDIDRFVEENVYESGSNSKQRGKSRGTNDRLQDVPACKEERR